VASNSATRKRGVRASRTRLYHALSQAGLRSQAELATRIADLEQLESDPRSLVNRVFREQPVEPSSLERIARALGVDAWTLYLNGEDGYHGTEATESVATSKRPWLGRALAAAAAAFALLAFTLTVLDRYPSPTPSAPNAKQDLKDLPGRPSVAVVDFEGDEELGFSGTLRQRMAPEFSVVMGSMETLAEQYGAREAAERLRAQWLVGGEHARHGRWSGLRIWLEHDGQRLPVWNEGLPATRLRREQEALVDEAFAAIRDHILGRQPREKGIADDAALEDYLIGRMHLDRALTELNVRRAQGRFEAALRRDPGFARAHAGLCLALLEEIWIQDEQWALEQAGSACREALALEPEDPVVRLAHAALLRRSGDIEGAIKQLETASRDEPDDADLLNLKATLYFHRFRQTGETADLKRARSAAGAAAAADPDFWKPLFTRAIIEYFANDIEAAVEASREALARDENTSILTNLGTFELCAGNIEQARERYLRVRELAPQAHSGDEFLGLVHYYLGEYEISRQLRQRAIEALADGSPEIHQMWSGLAESRWRSGDTTGAVQAWLQAIEIVERDRLRGTSGQDDAAARVHYYAAVRKLSPRAVSDEVIEKLRVELDALTEAGLSASAWVSAAKAYLNLDQSIRAKTALANAAETCPGYARLPDFADLTKQ